MIGNFIPQRLTELTCRPVFWFVSYTSEHSHYAGEMQFEVFDEIDEYERGKGEAYLSIMPVLCYLTPLIWVASFFDSLASALVLGVLGLFVVIAIQALGQVEIRQAGEFES